MKKKTSFDNFLFFNIFLLIIIFFKNSIIIFIRKRTKKGTIDFNYVKRMGQGSLREFIVLVLRRRDNLKNGDDNLKFGLKHIGFWLWGMKRGT